MAKFLNTGMNGDTVGYSCWAVKRVNDGLLSPLKTIYAIQLNALNPYLFQDNSGRLHRIPYDLLSDDGSVHGLGQMICPKDRFLIFWNHDGWYHSHMQTISDDGGKTWQTIPIAKDEADALLKEGCLADPYPASAFESDAIFEAVQKFGQGDWDAMLDY